MDASERRRPENAQLRVKIDRIQTVNQELQVAIDQVQAQTVAWAREQKLSDLPHPELAKTLSAAFATQRAAIADIQKEIKGAAGFEIPSQLLTDDELKALMK